MLARAGHSVTLIGRPIHVEAMNARGLRLQTHAFDTLLPVQASTDAQAIADTEALLFCVKSSDTEGAGATLKPHLPRGIPVLSLQNGVDNADRLSDVLQQPVIASVVYVGTDMAGPGHVRHHGRGELVLGDSPLSSECSAWLSAAEIPNTVSANIQGALWTKFIINGVYNAPSAITQLPYGEMVQVPGMWTLMRQAYDECMAIAHAANVKLDQPVWPMIEAIAQTMQGQYSSTAQDLQRSKATEIDHLNGKLVRLGEQFGVPTPTHLSLWSMVKGLERRN
jgi:2-dehydropantoate 2-reductase